MNKKPFSKEQYDKDDVAKYQVVKWLRDSGYDAQVNPARYGIDVLAEKNGVPLMIEVEVKHNWKGETFQYSTLHYSGRKKKFLDNPERTFFMTLNHERTHAFLVSGVNLVAAPTIVKDTIYTRGEEFIEVEIEHCSLIEIPPLENTDG
jgi:hypothetical protein